MKLSIVIPTKNDEKQKMLAASLERMRALSVEIIVVDWGGDCEVPGFVKRIVVPSAIARARNRDSDFAMAIAWNVGIRRATGEYICATGNDTYCEQDFLDWVYDGARNGTYYVISRKHVGETAPVRISRNYGAGAAYFAHRDVWHALRGLDEKFIYYGWSDRELVERAKLLGFGIEKVYEVSLYHTKHPQSRMRRRRKVNEIVFPQEELIPRQATVNDENWGLGNETLLVL